MRAPLVVLVAFLLAGCTAPPNLHTLDVKDTVAKFTGYTWPPLQITNGNGTQVPRAQAPEWARGADVPAYVEQLVPGSGGEPNIGVTKKGNVFVSTFDQVMRSGDFGRNWTQVHDYTSPNYPTSADYWSTADPMLWVDPLTDRVFGMHMMSTTCNYLAWSDKEGDKGSWTERPYTCGSPLLDHEKLMTAPYGPNAIKPPVTPYPDVLYLCVNKFTSIPLDTKPLGTWCSVSYDSGETFLFDQAVVPPTEFCPGINGHPAAFPDGTVVVPIGTDFGTRCKRPVTVGLTADSGRTWTSRTLSFSKAKGQVEIDPDITVTPDGTAYMVYRDLDQIEYLVRSKDKFQTWDGPWRVSPKDQTINVFAGVTSGDNGRIAISYLGTHDPQVKGATPSNATGGSRWHLFVTTSLNAADADPVFVTSQVTPNEDPAQVGCIWLQGGGGGVTGCRNLLDFIDSVRDTDGRVYTVFTDGCSPRNGCTTDIDAVSYQSRDRQVAVAVQDHGLSLFAAKGSLAPLGLQPPLPLPR